MIRLPHAILVGLSLIPSLAWAADAPHEPAWVPAFPAGQPLPPSTTYGQFWPALLERYCTKSPGQLRTDRPADVCTTKNGKLPDSPLKAMRRLSTIIDNANLDKARADQAKKVIDLTSALSDLKGKLADLQRATQSGLPEKIQPANDAAAAQGSPAQTDAVPSVAPVSQAATTAAIAGTPAGMRVLASVSVNPLGMVTTSAANDPTTAQAGATGTRLADLTLVVPINPAGSAAGSGLGSFDYVGVRLRVNATPLLKSNLYDLATARVDQAFQAALKGEGTESHGVEGLISSFDPSGCSPKFTAAECNSAAQPDFNKQIDDALECFTALESVDADVVALKCSKPLSTIPSVADTEAALRTALMNLRDQYDADYLGLDARYDFGDPTFSMNPAARGSHLLAGLAAGHRFLYGSEKAPRRRFFGLRARGGYQLTSLNNNMDRNSSLDFAGGIETGVINDLTVFKLTAGIEGRHTWQTVPTNADTNFVDLKIGVDIPLSDGSRVGALLSLPVNGSHGTILSLAGNWSALAGALAK